MEPKRPSPEKIAAVLPYLRRYARALTGSQDVGDQIATDTLKAIVNADVDLTADENPKVSIFQAIDWVWTTRGQPIENRETGLLAEAQRHLTQLTPKSREALLLHVIEGFTVEEVGRVIGVSLPEATSLVEVGRTEMMASVRGRVLVIEDESVIALDLQDILEDLGHQVIGIANTHSEALRLGKTERPDLVLADIRLADDSSGVDAVKALLAEHPSVPVIFITAYPELLLTGADDEPAFLINKPYSVEEVQSATAQALFFSSTQTLTS